MMLGFKRRFAPFVRDGSKRHTIRAKRVYVPRVGEICHCYVDPRQKSMALLGRWPCVRVQDFLLFNSPLQCFIAVDGVILDREERNLLAYRDGFRTPDLPPEADANFQAMLEFWAPRLNESPRWSGDIIHWDYDHPVRGTSRRRKPGRAPSPDCPNTKRRPR